MKTDLIKKIVAAVVVVSSLVSNVGEFVDAVEQADWKAVVQDVEHIWKDLQHAKKVVQHKPTKIHNKKGGRQKA